MDPHLPTDAQALARAVKAEAREVGFDLCGITTSAPFPQEGGALVDWINRGYHGEMDYMARNATRSPRPAAVVPGARALVVVGLYYGGSSDAASAPDREPAAPRGRISRYAGGDDYHEVMGSRLKRLAQFLLNRGAQVARYYVDTGPMIDRAAARRAGLGWYGKNTLIITRAGFGSWVFLGEILTDLPLPPDLPARGDCGRCRLCLDACPTGAIVSPYTVDARRCISYLTIESRGPIPRALRPALEDMVFGCDRCQEVCPFNAALEADGGGEVPRDPALAPSPRRERPELVALLGL